MDAEVRAALGIPAGLEVTELRNEPVVAAVEAPVQFCHSEGRKAAQCE